MVKLISKPSSIFYLIGLLILSSSVVYSQSISLEECYKLARENYPLIKQRDLIAKSSEYSISNASKAYLPQFSINGQASYQSDVTSIDIKIPGFPEIEAPSKDQYKVYAELNQVLYDGGAISNQKKLLRLSSEVETQRTEVELYKVKERINQLYFGILLIDEQLKQFDLIKSDLNESIKKTTAGISNGTAYQSNLNMLQAELIKTNQRDLENQSTRRSFLKMLSQFIGKDLNEAITLEKPMPQTLANTNNRPELRLFTLQQNQIDQQLKLSNTKNLPKLGLFIQGGYGKPALNVLKNEFEAYYIGGVRLNWNLSNLYTSGNERSIASLNNQLIDTQKEVFLFNTTLNTSQQTEETEKLSQLIKMDEEIVVLKTKVKNTSKVQLENGIITTSDYIRELNAEDQARTNLILHQIQLLQAQYNLKTITGN